MKQIEGFVKGNMWSGMCFGGGGGGVKAMSKGKKDGHTYSLCNDVFTNQFIFSIILRYFSHENQSIIHRITHP